VHHKSAVKTCRQLKYMGGRNCSVRLSASSRLSASCFVSWHYLYKKLSCRRKTARRFTSLNISLNHWRPLKVIRNYTL